LSYSEILEVFKKMPVNAEPGKGIQVAPTKEAPKTAVIELAALATDLHHVAEYLEAGIGAGDGEKRLHRADWVSRQREKPEMRAPSDPDEYAGWVREVRQAQDLLARATAGVIMEDPYQVHDRERFQLSSRITEGEGNESKDTYLKLEGAFTRQGEGSSSWQRTERARVDFRPTEGQLPFAGMEVDTKLFVGGAVRVEGQTITLLRSDGRTGVSYDILELNK
jgi:hypothetical protein